MPQEVNPCHETDALFVTLEHVLPPAPPVDVAEKQKALRSRLNLPSDPVRLQISHEMGDSIGQIFEPLELSQVRPESGARSLRRGQVERENLHSDLHAVISDYLLQPVVEIACMWAWNASVSLETVGGTAKFIHHHVDVGMELVADERNPVRC